MTWRHIMFAVDSPLEVRPRILSKIAHLARAFDAEVELFHCVFDWDTVHAGRIRAIRGEQSIREIVDEGHRKLDVLTGRLRADGIRARSTVRWDYPSYEGIVRQALRHKPDLLVAQSTRHVRLSRLMLTHTDYRLIESCPAPLLLIKSGRSYVDTSVVAAVDPMHAHDKPAALDRAILQAASAISDGLRAPLHVYHACAPWPKALERSSALRQIPEPVYAEVCAAYEGKAEARVQQLARPEKVPNDRVHLVWGDAAERLPAFAKSISAGIVAMGAVSRSGFKHAFIGHTAERVLDALDCDVLIVKPPGFVSSVRLQSVHRLPKSETPRARYIW